MMIIIFIATKAYKCTKNIIKAYSRINKTYSKVYKTHLNCMNILIIFILIESNKIINTFC